MATTETQCANCQKTGLPILPVRYTVLPSTVSAKIPAGISGHGVTDVALSEHRYGVRILREGWLYLFYVKGARGSNYWEAYKVTADGRLWKQSLPLPQVPVTHPACAQCAVAVPMDIIAIERPEKCSEVYIAFSEYPWHDDIFKQYASDAALRKKRMQCIEPAKWIAGGTNSHAAIATEQGIDEVIEYMPGFDPKLLQPPPFQSPGHTLSDATGRYDPSLVRQEATRYPLAIRQATPLSASAALVKLMHTVGATKAGQHHPPMLLALWDAIGNVHELNGFRNDAGSMLAVYVRERAVQIDALDSVGAAEKAVRNGAVASTGRWRSARQAAWEGFMSAPMAGEAVMPVLQSPEEEAASAKRIEDAGRISPAEAKKIGDAEWPKYEKKLNLSKYKGFKPWFESIQKAVAELQGHRTADVAAWLKAPLLLATLHDYHENDVANGLAFEGVVNEAITGLPSEEKGAEVVVDLVNQTDPTQPTSLVWRAFAYNQAQPKVEIKELLAQATAHKSTTMEQVGESMETVAKVLEKLKTFVEFREKMGEVKEHEQPISATEYALKKFRTDRLIVTIGDALFKWTLMGKVADCAGSYMIRGALLMRIGISQKDTIGLVRESAKVEPAMRAKLQAGYKALRARGVAAAEAYAQTLQALAEDDDGKLLRAKWNAVRLTSEGAEAVHPIRIASTLAIIEVFCFTASLAKADKNGEDYALLFGSGFSATSACLQASTKAMTAMAKDAAQTLANLKAITGYLSGAAAAIQSVVDLGKAREAGLNQRYALMSTYFLKGMLGGAATLANLLTALSSSAPLIARLNGGRNVAWLGKVGAGIAGATARNDAMADAAVKAGSRAEWLEGWFAKSKAANAAGRVAIGDAAAEAGVVVGERGALLLIGRAVLFMAGWEVAVVITVIQLLIWYFSDNDLQTWMEKCAFGLSPNKPAWEPAKQHEEFEKALKSVGLQAEEEVE